MTDKQLIKVVNQFTRGMINGKPTTQKCYLVCAPLYSYLRFIGVDVELIEGEVETDKLIHGHYWLQLSDGRIIDPTANQFEGLQLPANYIGQLPSSYKKKSNLYSQIFPHTSNSYLTFCRVTL